MFTRRQMVMHTFAGAVTCGWGSVTGATSPAGFFARRKLAIGLQLYTLGPLPFRDLTGTLTKVAAMGYREVELPGLLGRKPEELRAAADGAGLRIVSLHLGTATASPSGALTVDNDPAEIASVLKTLGAEAVILPMLPIPPGFRPHAGQDFQASFTQAVTEAGKDYWRGTAAYLNRCGDGLRKQGTGFGYHNHNVEFTSVDGETGFDILARETDPSLVSFEVDIGWVAAAGLDPLRFLERHAGRLRWMHVKDMKASTRPNFGFRMDPTEVGSGALPWKQLLPAAYRAGVRHFFVEQEPPFVMDRLDAAAKSAAYLQQLS